MTAPTTSAPGRGLLSGVKVVDADTHITEWNDLWTSRAPASYKSPRPSTQAGRRSVGMVHRRKFDQSGVGCIKRHPQGRLQGVRHELCAAPD